MHIYFVAFFRRCPGFAPAFEGTNRFYNESCPDESKEQGDECIYDCDQDFVFCWVACQGDQTCMRECSSKEEDCLNNCPCHLMCPIGCPCETYECKGCEDLHPEEIEQCHNECFEAAGTCGQTCKPYDSGCLIDCVENVYNMCIVDCACYEAPTTTPATTLTTTTIVTTTTTTTTTVRETFDDVMFGTTTDQLTAAGFKLYLKAHHTEDHLGDRKFPPSGSSEIFVGCGRTGDIDTFIKLGAVMTEDELFQKKSYPTSTVVSAQPVKNFFTYYSSNTREPWGFSGEKNIYLGFYDRYDCQRTSDCEKTSQLDKHRLCVLDDASGDWGLIRCGEYIASYGPLDDFTLVMYYR